MFFVCNVFRLLSGIGNFPIPQIVREETYLLIRREISELHRPWKECKQVTILDFVWVKLDLLGVALARSACFLQFCLGQGWRAKIPDAFKIRGWVSPLFRCRSAASPQLIS